MSFNSLPLELKWKIWEHELHHERFLRIQLEPRYVIRGCGGVHKVSDEYRVIVLERPGFSKLLRLSSESRDFANNFYRVKLPCHYRWGDNLVKNATLYFNPELDTLEVRGWRGYFAQFSHDTWALDRRHVGLINIMVGTSHIDWDFGGVGNPLGGYCDDPSRRLKWRLDPDDHTQWPEYPDTRMKEALMRLKRVVIVPEHCTPRGIQGPEGLVLEPKDGKCPFNALTPITEFMSGGRGPTHTMYRRRPIANTSLAQFEHIASDRRHIFLERHLLADTRLRISTASAGLVSWFRMLDEYVVKPDKNAVVYYFLLPSELARLKFYKMRHEHMLGICSSGSCFTYSPFGLGHRESRATCACEDAVNTAESSVIPDRDGLASLGFGLFSPGREVLEYCYEWLISSTFPGKHRPISRSLPRWTALPKLAGEERELFKWLEDRYSQDRYAQGHRGRIRCEICPDFETEPRSDV